MTYEKHYYDGNWQPPTEHNPIFAVLWLLLGVVGLQFFVLSTSAPLLQKWFAGTGHPAHDGRRISRVFS